MATCCAASGTTTGRPKIPGAIRRTASERLAPPMRITRSDAHALGEQGVEADGQAAQHALDRGTGEVPRGRGPESQAVHGAGGERPVRRPLPLEVRDDDEAVGACRRVEGERRELALVDAEEIAPRP